jgi:signal peptidase I
MAATGNCRRFFFPAFSPGYLLRISVLAVSAYLVFGFLWIPLTIRGRSMEPTYRDGSFNFCWRLKYFFRGLERHDVVFIRLAGSKVMLMKRVVGLEGEEVEFRKGGILVDGRMISEPYVVYWGDWNLPPRRVEKGCVYVVGDNRANSMADHYFGQTPAGRVAGGPLW